MVCNIVRDNFVVYAFIILNRDNHVTYVYLAMTSAIIETFLSVQLYEGCSLSNATLNVPVLRSIKIHCDTLWNLQTFLTTSKWFIWPFPREQESGKYTANKHKCPQQNFLHLFCYCNNDYCDFPLWHVIESTWLHLTF